MNVVADNLPGTVTVPRPHFKRNLSARLFRLPEGP